MHIEREKLVEINDDEKAVVLKGLKELYSTTNEIFNLIEQNNLTEDMKTCLLNLIESHTSEISKILGYDSNSSKKISERYFDIREAYKTIEELKHKLSNNAKTDGLKEFLYDIDKALNEWWSNQGYELVSDCVFGGFGFKGRFNLDTSYLSYMATRPITSKKNKISKLEEMVKEGYEFCSIERKEYVLLDTPKNRELITSTLKSKFKSITIRKWNNFCISKSNNFQLRSFECCIKDIQELKDLVEEMKELEK